MGSDVGGLTALSGERRGMAEGVALLNLSAMWGRAS